MGSSVSRTVDIKISNNTQNITLMNARTYFYSGHRLQCPQPSVSPGSTSTWKFANNTWLWGCNGVLALEAESFTLAIYFSNPIDYNRFSVEMGLELSTDKGHRGNLEAVYDRLVGICRASSSDNFMFPTTILKEPQDQTQLRAGPVKVTATISRARNAVIKVKVEEQKSSGNKAKVETRCRAKHVQEK